MSVMESAIGLLSPPECINCGAEGSAICKPCSSELIKPFGERCWRCNQLSPRSRTCQTCRRTGSPTRVFIVTDHDGISRQLISLYKFGHQRAAAGAIAGLMSETFLKFAGVELPDLLVVPVPTASGRIRERGFDHAELLSRKIALRLRLKRGSALRRTDQTRQLGSKREDRLQQLRDSFGIKDYKNIQGRHILLIDDVITTGGTLISAAHALRAAGAKQVDALIFAKRL